jgi:cytochrome c
MSIKLVGIKTASPFLSDRFCVHGNNNAKLLINGGDIQRMDDLKFNKVAAGFLLAALLAMAGYKLSEVLVPHQKLAQNAYPIEVQVASTTTAAPAAAKGPEPILALLASADVEAGIKTAKKCTACHVFDKGGKNKVGPGLWNIVNADKANVDGFSYSAALAEMDGGWDYQALNTFLYKPKAYVAGTKMNFAGLKKPQDRANIIAYLRSLADAPAALPSEGDIAAETSAQAQ